MSNWSLSCTDSSRAIQQLITCTVKVSTPQEIDGTGKEGERARELEAKLKAHEEEVGQKVRELEEAAKGHEEATLQKHSALARILCNWMTVAEVGSLAWPSLCTHTMQETTCLACTPLTRVSPVPL